MGFDTVKIAMSSTFHQLYLDSAFTDVTILIQDHSFKCHRIVLAANSGYFNIMFQSEFKEKYQNEIVLKEIDPQIASLAIAYCYRALPVFTSIQQAEDTRRLALMWDINGQLIDHCIRYLISALNCTNCCEMASLDDFGSNKFKKAAIFYVQRNLKKCVKTQSVKDLNYHDFINVLNGIYLNNNSKTVILDAIRLWIKADEIKRHRYLTPLLRYYSGSGCTSMVRYWYNPISRGYLFSIIKQTNYDADTRIRENLVC